MPLPPPTEAFRPTVLRCCDPGRTLVFDLAAGSVLAAVDGRVRVVYRDPSLDGVDGLSSRVSLVIEEGRAWTLPCGGLVEAWSLDGRVVVAVSAARRAAWFARMSARVSARMSMRMLARLAASLQAALARKRPSSYRG